MMRLNRLWAGIAFCAALLGAGNAGAAGTKPSPKEAKVGVIIEMINTESNGVSQNYGNYTKRVKDLQKGPTCTESGPQSWISSMGPSAPERFAAYRKGLKKAPKLEVDAQVLEMVDALDALYKPEGEAADYYFLSKFKADSCKRGQELHPVLMAGWIKYLKAEQTVRDFLDKYTDERDAADLTTIQKKYGKALHYYHRKLVIDAKPLLRSVADAKDIDVATVRAKLAVFETTLTEATAIVEKEKKGKNADALYQGGYEQLLTTAGWYKDSTSEVLRVLDNEAKDPKAAARTNSRPTAMKNFITSYNGLIEQSNKTMYSKAMK